MPTILIVEDSLTDQALAAGALEKEGFTIVIVGSEKEAKAQIASSKPDAIVLDVILPDRSGFELCRDLKDEKETQNIPIVVCSSKGSKMDKYWGMQQGADAYLAKPVNLEELVNTVKRLVR